MTIWRGSHPPVLASQSRARQVLLGSAGLAFEAMPANIDERAIQQKSGLLKPGEIAGLLAQEKARFVSAKMPDRIVIGADQTLSLGELLFSKPAGRTQAMEQLQALAGKTHELHSAVAVVRGSKTLFSEISIARMTMRRLSSDDIRAYLDVAGEAVTTSVGAYQLEGLGVHLFERVEGDHFTILGLPLMPLLAFLRGQGLLGF